MTTPETIPFQRCLVASLAGLGLITGMAAAGPPVKVVIQLPYTHQFQFAGLYAAQAKGYFLEQGLEVELRPTSSDLSKPLNEVLEGRAQFGVISGPKLVASCLAGGKVVAVAAIMQHSPQVLITRQDDNIRTPHDLIGKRVALDNASPVSEVRLMLRREGVDMAKIVVVPNRWDVDELKAGTADAMSTFVIDGPYRLERSGIKVNIMRPVDYGVDFYGDTLYTTETLARKQPGLVEAVHKAVIQGWDYALKYPDEMIDWILSNHADRRPEMDRPAMQFEARQVARLINADLVNLGHMNKGRWRVMGELFHPEKANPDADWLDRFYYEAPRGGTNQYQWIFRWVWWGLAAAVAVALIALFANWRLQRLVAHRTRELQLSERRQREIFDLAPAPITRNDYGPVLPHLKKLRATGVTDLGAHLAKHPDLVREWCALVRVIDANQLALRLAVVGSVAELDRVRMTILTPESIEIFREELQAIWAGRDQMRIEKSYISTAGQRRDFIINWSAPHSDGQPDYTRIQLVYTDLTEIRKAGLALRESEERYRSLFEITPNPMFIYDLGSLRFIAVNDAAVRHYGYSREEFLAMDIMDIRPPEDVERLRQALPNLTEDDETGIRAWRHCRKNGSIIHVEVYTRTLVIEGRRCVLVLPFDITERLQAEQALRESESRYRELFENAIGGIYRSMPDGRFIAVNPALVRMLGFNSAEELIDFDQTKVDQPFYVQPGRWEDFKARLVDGDYVTNFESEIRCKNGATIWISENIRIVRDAQGKDLYHEGFVSDITLHRRLEAEMLRASKLEAVGILAGGIAHDFNNILTVVLGNLTLAEMDAGPEAPFARLLREARRATLRARDLTQQLLTFAKGGEPVRAAVNLPELLTESADFALHGAKARAEYQIAPDLWPANADKGQLGQVVQNLAINSVQAMPDGGILKILAANVVLGESADGPPLPPGRYVRLTVADTGTGIAAEHLPKIFDPYFTTKQQGSGLGLATVYSIVKKHQGHIEVESQPGRGTAFHIWLPATGPAEAEGAPEATTTAPLQARVLFMDDEEPIREMARMLLDRLAVASELAADGAEAVQKYQQALASGCPFDVVLMDLTVPGGMGGREAMVRLREIDPSVRAIVSSGYSRDPVLANYRAHGFQGILPKPYDLGQLRQVLEETLRGGNGSRPPTQTFGEQIHAVPVTKAPS
jgi:PAS domain S-box-containing protein